MILIACVDEALNILTHEQIMRHPYLLDRMLQITKENKFWMNHNSAELFSGMEAGHVNIDENFLCEATELDSCFIEDADAAPYMRWVEHIILFRVPEKSSSVHKLSIPLEGWVEESHVSFHAAPDIFVDCYIREG